MKKYLVAITLGISLFSFAQDKDFRAWGTLNSNQKIDDKFNIATDIQYRTYEDVDQFNQLLIRTGIGYNLTQGNNNILLGYAFVHTRVPTNDDEYSTFNENRIFQQFNTKHGLSKLGLNHRFRFEERLMNDDIFFRFRYQLAATIPLNKPSLQKDTWYFKASNELFLNAIKQNNFDRNRLNFNVGYAFSPNIMLEAGYMKQHVQHSQTDHLQIGITINNPIIKKPS